MLNTVCSGAGLDVCTGNTQAEKEIKKLVSFRYLDEKSDDENNNGVLQVSDHTIIVLESLLECTDFKFVEFTISIPIESPPFRLLDFRFSDWWDHWCHHIWFEV